MPGGLLIIMFIGILVMLSFIIILYALSPYKGLLAAAFRPQGNKLIQYFILYYPFILLVVMLVISPFIEPVIPKSQNILIFFSGHILLSAMAATVAMHLRHRNKWFSALLVFNILAGSLYFTGLVGHFLVMSRA